MGYIELLYSLELLKWAEQQMLKETGNEKYSDEDLNTYAKDLHEKIKAFRLTIREPN